MGLIRGTINAVKGAASNATGGFVGGVSGVLGQAMHQEYFVSGSMAGDILMKRAEQVKPNGSANKGNDANVITNGSVIDVQVNQCMIIVENGKVVEACMEPGRFLYDTSLAPSFFAGDGKFSDKVKGVAKEIWEQTKMGGQRRNTQRIYFINTGLLDKALQWGVGNVSFKHTQRFEGLPAPLVCTVHVKGFGTARVRLSRPLDFYELYGVKYAGGDNSAVVSIESLTTFFENTRQKMSQAVSIAMAEIGRDSEIAYDEIMVGENMTRLADLVNKQLEDSDLYKVGFDCYDFTVGGSGLNITEADAEMISTRQQQMMMLANGAANYDIQSQMAAGFANGAEKGGIPSMMGMGMVMGGGMGGLGNMGTSQPMYNPQYGQQPQQSPMQPQMSQQGQQQMAGMGYQQTPAHQPTMQQPQNNGMDSWKCSCGNVATGNFCPNCGTKRPQPQQPSTWTCSCGNVNTGNFCFNCGAKKPVKSTRLVCDKCGWTGENNGVRFCPNCGDPVTEADMQ